MNISETSQWYGLLLGNSRTHCAHFQGREILKTYHSQYEQAGFDFAGSPVLIASVVPKKTLLWQNYPNAQIIELHHINLKNSYPTLGIDRALALSGAMANYGTPALVIDAGTALTLSALSNSGEFVGGAILPGLGLQFDLLTQATGALPKAKIPETLPPYWANSTSEAIQSGIIHFILAGLNEFIKNWQSQFGQSHIVFTGGDGEYLYKLISQGRANFIYDPNLVFLGIRQLAFKLERGFEPNGT